MRIGTRWWMIGLVTIGTVLNYLARSSLSVAAPTLKGEFAMTTQQYSWVVAAFQAAYTVMQPVAGYLLDMLGLRLGFAVFAVGWSVANCCHAFAAGWPSLAFFRGMLGLTEAAAIPAGLKTVAEWFPPRERTVATGWFNIGSSLGAMIAPPIVVTCIAIWGWQSAFVVTGGVGIVWAAVWYIAYRPPALNPRLTDAERAHILDAPEEAAPVEGAPLTWRAVLRTRDFWSIAIPRFLADPAWQTFSFFIPLYLVEAKGLDLKSVAAFAWLPFLAADAGSLLGGYYAPWVMRRFDVSLVTSRKIVVTTGALLMIGPACIGLTVSPAAAIALFCIGGFAHQMLSGALMTLAADLFDRRVVATAGGMAGSAAWIGGMSFSLTIGALADTIGYNPLFACLAVFDLIGAAVLWTLLRRPAPRAQPV
ncbi:ExuT transport protein [Sphingomonas metalli]|uniref:ExuT transport protein n=1 Tax=Sphingomonas metalli TaxID=1779358 RepID=A0A916WRH2_9SPHN|nr:MFS transporter [Sphingomonas metalli]GGB22939.1 ExuT transport protein [Sphingomonas metalli]